MQLSSESRKSMLDVSGSLLQASCMYMYSRLALRATSQSLLAPLVAS